MVNRLGFAQNLESGGLWSGEDDDSNLIISQYGFDSIVGILSTRKRKGRKIQEKNQAIKKSYLTKTFGIERRLSHDSMCSFLTRQIPIRIAAFNFNGSRLNTCFFSHGLFNHSGLIPLLLSPSHIHPEKHVSPVLHWK